MYLKICEWCWFDEHNFLIIWMHFVYITYVRWYCQSHSFSFFSLSGRHNNLNLKCKQYMFHLSLVRNCLWNINLKCQNYLNPFSFFCCIIWNSIAVTHPVTSFAVFSVCISKCDEACLLVKQSLNLYCLGIQLT